jgi:hypothetical protein
MMLNSFLQERFLMAGIIKECNDNVESLKQDLEQEEATTHRLNDIITKLNIHNITLKNELKEIVQSLQSIYSSETSDFGIVRAATETLLTRARGMLE